MEKYIDKWTAGLSAANAAEQVATSAFRNFVFESNTVPTRQGIATIAPAAARMQDAAFNLNAALKPAEDGWISTFRQQAGAEDGTFTKRQVNTTANRFAQMNETRYMLSDTTAHLQLKNWVNGTGVVTGKEIDLERLGKISNGSASVHALGSEYNLAAKRVTELAEADMLMKKQQGIGTFKRDIGAVVASQFLNQVGDRLLYPNKQVNGRVLAVDAVAAIPIMATQRLGLVTKATSLAGIHVGARAWDVLDRRSYRI